MIEFQAFGIVFVIDCSLNAPFDAIREMLHRTMYHKNIRGKPLLIVANKQDLDQSIDVVDITYFFRIDEICNLLSTPCLIITSGMGNRTDLKDGMDWLVESIIENHNTLKNRMRFNGLLSPITRFKRQRTSLPRKVCVRVVFENSNIYMKYFIISRECERFMLNE